MLNKIGKWNKREKSVYERIKKKFCKPKGLSTKEKAVMAIHKLETALNKLRQTTEGLKRKDKKLFNKCIEARIAKNNVRATIYANECAQVRKMARLIIYSELAIEKAIVRLNTIGEISDVMVAMAPIAEVVRETKGRISGIIPSVAGKLDEVTNMLNRSVVEMSTSQSPKSNKLKYGSNVAKILEEANEAAENRIREKFPDLPLDLKGLEPTQIPTEANRYGKEIMIPIALTATGNETQREYSPYVKKQVYDYIKSCNGDLNIVQCASYLGLFPREVEKAVLMLKEEGQVALE
ncbi:MAG: hypothetical protein JSV20_01685 [Candidatus Bathyarchaeota archaeon]|nr:MAG: hypothetical protein JSV20_01685 [Candidatus Bathyarchaeota archaeon]